MKSFTAVFKSLGFFGFDYDFLNEQCGQEDDNENFYNKILFFYEMQFLFCASFVL